MKIKFLIPLLAVTLAAFVATAAPSVTASQSTATSGLTHTINVPPGPAGDMLVTVSVGQYNPIGTARIFGAPGWVNRSNPLCGRASGFHFKESDGTETSLTVTSNVSIAVQSWVLRVSGYNPVPPPGYSIPGPYGLNSRAYHYNPGEMYQDPPNIIMYDTSDTLWVVGAFNNGGSPTLYPSGYGFPLDAANTVRLVLAFKTATAYADNPGEFVLPAAVKGCVFGFGIS